MTFLRILVAATCFVGSVHGQPPVTPSCPTVSIIGPAGIPKPGEAIDFTATIANAVDRSSPVYKWTVSKGGEIVDGAGTPRVKVAWPDGCENVHVTVEIEGLPPGCPNKAAEVFGVSHCRPFGPLQIAEILGRDVKSSDERIPNVRRSVRENPHAQMFVISRYSRNPSRKAKEKKENEVVRLLALPASETSRIKFLHKVGSVDSVQFWLVPPGTNPPKP